MCRSSWSSPSATRLTTGSSGRPWTSVRRRGLAIAARAELWGSLPGRLERRALQQLADRLEAVLGDGDQKHVLRDPPPLRAAHQHAAAARRTEVLRFEVLLEPGDVAADGDAAAHPAKRPGLALGEVRARVVAKGFHVPALGRVGAEEDPVGSAMGE